MHSFIFVRLGESFCTINIFMCTIPPLYEWFTAIPLFNANVSVEFTNVQWCAHRTKKSIVPKDLRRLLSPQPIKYLNKAVLIERNFDHFSPPATKNVNRGLTNNFALVCWRLFIVEHLNQINSFFFCKWGFPSCAWPCRRIHSAGDGKRLFINGSREGSKVDISNSGVKRS